MVWTPKLNAVLGSLVVTVGFWLMAGQPPASVTAAVAVGVAALLVWRGATIGLVWAWATLLLGLESLAWPIATMVQLRALTAEPTTEQMGEIARSVLAGGFAAIFWLSFSSGIFRRVARQVGGEAPDGPVSPGGEPGPPADPPPGAGLRRPRR